jgi:RNA polymerase sigma factor (sigma-70 family)
MTVPHRIGRGFLTSGGIPPTIVGLMNGPDTEIGGVERAFPTTSWSSLGSLSSSDPLTRRRRLEELIARYWKPVYVVIRASWSKSNEDAKDLTQEFFVRAVLEGTLVEGFDPAKGSFRKFLKGALSHFMMNAARTSSALKRGGERKVLSLDGEAPGFEDFLEGARSVEPDRLFDAAWKREILGLAVRRLEQRLKTAGKDGAYRVFQRYDLESGPSVPSYEEVGLELGLTANVVKHSLAAAREEYRLAVTDVLRGYADTPEHLHQEIRDLFGA